MVRELLYNENFDREPPRKNRNLRGFANRLVDWGIAKDEHQANYILLGIAICCFLISIFIFSTGSSSGNSYGNYDTLKATHPELFQNNPPPVR